MLLRRKPVLCNYYVTYRCNASCSFCDIWEKPSPYISLDDVKKNFEDLKKLGVRIIDFTGGEPLLHQNIGEVLQLAKEFGFITTITTNGLLYPKRSGEIRGLVDMLHFSLDYSTSSKHDKARNVECFNKVLESIEIAKELGEKPDILMTVFSENLNEIGEIYDQISLPNDLMLILNPAFDYNNISCSTFSKVELDLLRKWGKKKLVYINDAFLDLRSDGGNHIEDPVCKAGSSTVVISPFNELIGPCYHSSLGKWPIEGDLFNLYNSEKVQRVLAQEGRFKECEGCVINCYMQPSFAVNLNKYWFSALRSTLKYNYYKSTWKQLFI
ncbi:radical SAM protein [Marinigracilibium pacificum]|uniref:Radical SAM protein n=1 Tax=Marinigracilibium pacificum TaxID=2729599 RepID=A0A848J1R2_9BACT|nr:radical SAM protein [Marinigracilibium pacificum]NMM49641.1 radical SAM protein [Marinigracilibium pacificum]